MSIQTANPEPAANDSNIASLGKQQDNAALPSNPDPRSDASLRAPALYLNRDLSWIKYSHRVLERARSHQTPLLERFKFLAIVSSNIDEFFMKRIGGLKVRQFSGDQKPSVDGETATTVLSKCADELAALQQEQEAVYHQLIKQAGLHGIEFPAYETLSPTEKSELRAYFIDNIFPLLTPLAIDRSHPFPFISNLSLNLLISIQRQDSQEPLHARVKIPVSSGTPRFISVGESTRFVRLEELIVANIDLLFPKSVLISCDIFRVTRNAIIQNEYGDLDDVLEMIQSELHNRKFAPVVRLQTASSMRPKNRKMLARALGLDTKHDVWDTDSLVSMSDLMEIASLKLPVLRHEPQQQI